MTVNNAGTIVGNVGISIGGDSATINNFGSIIATSTSQPAIRFTGGSSVTPSAFTLFNEGILSAASGLAITSSSVTSPPLLITNIGTILGGISNAQAAANDRIENGGLIAGSISFGAGADTYDGRLGGTVDGNIDLGTGNDTFFGGDVAETVASSADADTFDFGGGNDTFVATASDGNDTVNGGAGIDTVDLTALASAIVDLNTGLVSAIGSIDQISNFENIKATNGADQLIGNSLSNTIEAFLGNDILDGRGAGADILDGGANNDTYIIDAGDRIVDASGIDLVQSSAVSLNLSSLGGGAVENAQLLGSAILNITGNGAKNVITGNAGKNTLTGGLEDDTFVFTTRLSNAKADRITDFNRIDDVMHLQNTGSGLFNGLANGALAASKFKSNTTGTATDADDRIVYNRTTGDLFFDSNGSGAGGAIKFATLTNKAVLTAADFFVI
jgi:Ca2+-binding RTX toxin-like protein